MERVGESVHVHLHHPSLVFLRCERECSPFDLTACCVFPAVVPLIQAVVPLALGISLSLSSGGTAASGQCYRHQAQQRPAAVVPAMHRPCTGQAFVLMRFPGGGGPVGLVVPHQPVLPEVRAVLPLLP